MKATVISLSVVLSEVDSVGWREVFWASFGFCVPRAFDSDVGALPIIARQSKCFVIKYSFTGAHNTLQCTYRGFYDHLQLYVSEKFQLAAIGVHIFSSFTPKAENKRPVLLWEGKFDLHNDPLMRKSAESLQ